MSIIEPQGSQQSSSFIKPKIPCRGEKLAPFCLVSSILLVLRELKWEHGQARICHHHMIKKNVCWCLANQTIQILESHLYLEYLIIKMAYHHFHYILIYNILMIRTHPVIQIGFVETAVSTVFISFPQKIFPHITLLAQSLVISY